MYIEETANRFLVKSSIKMQNLETELHFGCSKM